MYQGKEVGAERRYSDRLLELLLKGALPEKYSERFRLAGKDGGEILIKVVV